MKISSEILVKMPIGFILQSEQGEIESFNEAALQLLGMTADQLRGKTSLDPHWAATRADGSPFPGEEHPVMVTLKTGQPVRNSIMRVRRGDQKWIWLEINSFIVSESPRLAVATFVDISDRYAQAEQTRFTLEAAGLGIWNWDLVTNDLEWDPSLYHVYDLDAEQFTGAYDAWEKTLLPEDKEATVAKVHSAIKGESIFDSTFRIRTRDGTVRHIGGRGKVYRDDAGKPIRMIGVNWDRTREVELSKRVEDERAKSLHSAKLATLGEMAAGIAHEINNPLAIIHGNLELLERNRLDEVKFKSRSDIIRNSISRISKIVGGLRKFSRSTQDQPHGKVWIKNVIEESLILTQHKIEKRGIQLKNELRDSEIVFQGNELEMTQVLVNLLNNASDAIRDFPEKWIQISAHEHDSNVCIRITDSGSGISQSSIEKIFNPFYTTKPVGEGTGLGLSISKGIIEEHHGTLEYQLVDGHTSFVMCLPKGNVK